MSKSIGAREAQEFLEQAARYFQKRPTGGEDAAHWSNVTNSENCRAIADLIEQQGKVLDDMERALQPFSSAVFNDNGDVTFNYTAFNDDDLFRAYSVLKKLRAARALLPQPPNKGE